MDRPSPRPTRWPIAPLPMLLAGSPDGGTQTEIPAAPAGPLR